MKCTFADDRITIRPYQTGDVDALYEAALESRQAVYPWLAWCHPNYSRNDSLSWVSTRKDSWESDWDYSFVISDRESGRFLGGVGLNQINRLHQLCNLGYWVRSSATGAGVATRAVLLVSRFGLEEAGFNRLEIVAAIDNHASQRVAEKAGALKEGVLKMRIIVHNMVYDAVLYSITREEGTHLSSPA